MAISSGKAIGVAILLALVAGWPSIDSAKAKWDTDRARESAETRQKIQGYAKMREELDMPSPFPPKDMVAKQEAEARRLGGGGKSVFEGAASRLGPTYMEVEASVSGAEHCRHSVKAFGDSGKDVRVYVNGKTAHRKEAWKLCGKGANAIRVVRG